MKLHLNLPKSYHLRYSILKIAFSTFLFNKAKSKISVFNIKVKSIKSHISNYLPKHWYDNIWNNLDFKI